MTTEEERDLGAEELRVKLSQAYDGVPVGDEQLLRLLPSPAQAPRGTRTDHAQQRSRAGARSRRLWPVLAAGAVAGVAVGTFAIAMNPNSGPASGGPGSSGESVVGTTSSTGKQSPSAPSSSVPSYRTTAPRSELVASSYAERYDLSLEEAKRHLAMQGGSAAFQELLDRTRRLVPETRWIGVFVDPEAQYQIVANLTQGEPVPALDKLAAGSDGQVAVNYLDTASLSQKLDYVRQADLHVRYPGKIQDEREDLATGDPIIVFLGSDAEAQHVQEALNAEAPDWIRFTVRATDEVTPPTFAAGATDQSPSTK